MTSKKTILISSIFIFIILFTVFGCCIFFRQNKCKTPVAKECPKIKNLDTKPAEENLNAEPKEEWSTYYDERYKYSLDFPSGLNVDAIYENRVELPEDSGGGYLITNGGVNFSYPADGPWAMIVNVFENSKYKSLDEWLESKQGEYEINVVEKRINIDGNEAMVTHLASVSDGKISEEFKNEKETVFIKDHNLFIIYTRSTRTEDYEKVWNSFKFNKEK
ncbi:MAG: hypothetical protein V1688_02770 [bacterium]